MPSYPHLTPHPLWLPGGHNLFRGQSIALLSHAEGRRGTSAIPLLLRPLNLPLQSKFGHGLAPSREEE